MTSQWLRTACASAVVALAATACSAGGSSSNGNSSSGAPEKTTLNVAVVPAMDSAGFFVALHQGLFAKEGLTVKYSPATSSETAIGTQLKGGYDITAGNYVSYIEAAADNHDPLQIVAEGSVMQKGSQVIFALPHSGINSLSDLKGKILGINAPLNIDFLLDASLLTEKGIKVNTKPGTVEPDAVNFPKSPIPFPTIGSYLSSKQVSAVTLPEPFASLVQQSLGAVEVADLNQGATQDFPIEGFVTTRAWARKYPNTLKRFLAALDQGQQLADTDRAAVEQAFESLPSSQKGKVSPIIAATISLNTYPLSIDAIRLQRVANVMYQFGLLKTRFKIAQMIAPASEVSVAG